jgi:two-component system alkaline phosphatase synthesis response regulator PhoP
VRTILVIDDHLVTLETICLILKKEGYKVFAAKNSQEAQEHFLGNEVDLVIVDHGLPRITGNELARRLKEIKNVSVLMLSGNTDLLEKPESVDALLPKPVSVHILLAEIKRLTAGTPDAEVAHD